MPSHARNAIRKREDGSESRVGGGEGRDSNGADCIDTAVAGGLAGREMGVVCSTTFLPCMQYV